MEPWNRAVDALLPGRYNPAPMWTVLWWLFLFAAYTGVYELLRYVLFRKAGLAFRRSAQEFVERHQVQIARFQFANKLLVRQTLLNDPDIHAATAIHARDAHCSLEEARTRVETYVEEIVPAFNFISYYKIGYPLARLCINTLYSAVVDRSEIERTRKVPEDAAVIYVLNHRSNFDFILAGYALSEQVALSYAVGEWARVWPLEELFKSFGSYFVRRNFREPLYHLVLEKYVQLLTRKAGKQAIFIEGGLSRDGRFREPKIGLLDYVMKVKRDPGFQRDLVFIPAAINFDRVLEDTYLLGEKHGKAESRGFLQRVTSLGRVIAHVGATVAVNVYRYLTGTILRHGYAAVCFGEPISLDAWLAGKDVMLSQLGDEERKGLVKNFAQHLMGRIGTVMPVTPVSLFARAFLDAGTDRVDRTQLMRRLRTLREALIASGARVVAGKEFERAVRGRATLADERALYQDDLFDVVDQMFAADVAQQTVDVALDVLTQRGLIRIEGDDLVLQPGGREILEYYANAIEHLVQGLPPADSGGAR